MDHWIGRRPVLDRSTAVDGLGRCDRQRCNLDESMTGDLEITVRGCSAGASGKIPNEADELGCRVEIVVLVAAPLAVLGASLTNHFVKDQVLREGDIAGHAHENWLVIRTRSGYFGRAASQLPNAVRL